MDSAGNGPVRLVIVERQGLYRDLLGSVLSGLDGIEVVGTYSSGRNATKAVSLLRPQVALLDTDLLDGSCLRLALALRRQLPSLGIVILSTEHDIELLTTLDSRALPEWCHLIDKRLHDAQNLGRVVQRVASRIARNGVETSRPDPPAPTATGRLSARQLEILGLVATGMSNAAVANELHLKEKTVENQLAQIYEKLDIDRERSICHPRVKAVLWYLGSTERDHLREGSSQSRSMSQGKR